MSAEQLNPAAAVLNPDTEPCWTPLAKNPEIQRRRMKGYECRVYRTEYGQGTWSFTLRGRGRRPVLFVQNGYKSRRAAKDAVRHRVDQLPECSDGR